MMRAERGPKVAVIGCGFGGIAAAVKLKQAGFDFTIFERSNGPGGVWWDNRYPGAEVDIPSSVYSFSFMPYDWTRTHARQEELQRYMEDVLDAFDLRRHCRFGSNIAEAIWDDEAHQYAVRLDSGLEQRFDVVISAVGNFSTPRYPDWPGLEQFQGDTFHTSRWNHAVDLTGKRIAVVGTGSTACQLLPAIAPAAQRVFMFQREPAWVLPKVTRDYSDLERAKLRRTYAAKWRRLRLLLATEWPMLGGRRNRPGSRLNLAEERRARAFIDSVFEARPDLKRLVTPEHPFGGKRPVQNDNFYETLLRDNVELVPRPVVRVTPSGVVDADGCEREIDVLILATGFLAADYLADVRVVGRQGRTIQEIWEGEPAAFLGIMVAGLPNFYMVHGPNTSSVNLVVTFELQADYIVRVLRRMRGGITAIEVRRDVMDAYNRWVQRRLQGTAWAVTRNYYKSESGRIVTQWPDGAILYGLLTKLCGRLPPVSHYRRRNHAVQPKRRASGESDRST